MYQCISDLAMGFVDVPPDGLSGYAESCCCLLKILQIDQVQYRQFFGKE